MEQKSEQFLRKRKFLLMLPVLILPFMFLAFWALGGGKGAGDQGKLASGGINTSLPGAKFTDTRPKDKFSLYEQRKLDSGGVKESGSFVKGLGFDTAKIFGNKGLGKSPVADANEAKIDQKLSEIRKVIAAPDKNTAATVQESAGQRGATDNPETERLRKMMEQMKSGGSAPDPELAQLNGMMDKILKIQHPELAWEDGAVKKSVPVVPDSIYKAIRAMIADNQKVMDGASVKLTLVDSVTLHGMKLGRGQALFGLCQLTNQRLLLNIRKVRLGTSIVPVDLTVFDMDGMEGIRAKDAVTQDAMRSGAENAVQGLELMSMDQSLATQAAGAGVEAAKTLFSRKVRRIKVKLKGGQLVLLRINRN